MKIVLAGGSGQIGTVLAREFSERGDEVVVLTRWPQERPWKTVVWDGVRLGDWSREVDGAEVVVNLAGRSVNCRHTAEHQREMLESRVDSTRVLGQAIAAAASPPLVWLQASTATIYAHRFDAPNNEDGIIGGDEPGAPTLWNQSVNVARAWEASASTFRLPRTRLVLMRSSLLMSPDRGGIFDTLLRLVRYGLGGTAGSGKQYVSWMHIRDFVRAIDWAIDNEALFGAINFTAPQPLPNAEFMRLLRKAWGISLGLPASERMIEIGAALVKSESELMLKSRRVEPARLLASGFQYTYPAWEAAAVHLCELWEATHRLSMSVRKRYAKARSSS